MITYNLKVTNYNLKVITYSLNAISFYSLEVITYNIKVITNDPEVITCNLDQLHFSFHFYLDLDVYFLHINSQSSHPSHDWPRSTSLKVPTC